MIDTEENVKEVKIIFLGDSGVGKSCIINRYINNLYNANIDTTLGSSYSSKIIKKIKLNIN